MIKTEKKSRIPCQICLLNEARLNQYRYNEAGKKTKASFYEKRANLLAHKIVEARSFSILHICSLAHHEIAVQIRRIHFNSNREVVKQKLESLEHLQKLTREATLLHASYCIKYGTESEEVKKIELKLQRYKRLMGQRSRRIMEIAKKKFIE